MSWVKMMPMDYHSPVLLNEAVGGLDIKNDGVYVDVTFGGGGHSKEILQRIGPKGKLIAFDQDKDALLNNISDSRLLLINENFKHMRRFLKFKGINSVDGILADFGVSSHQFDSPDRGFSIRFDAPLDMRMNQENQISALTIINEYKESDLKEIKTPILVIVAGDDNRIKPEHTIRMSKLIKNSKLEKIPENTPVYDISSGKFIVRQGNIVKEYVSEKIEE